MTMSLVGLTYLFIDWTAKHTPHFILSFGEETRPRWRVRGSCLRRMLRKPLNHILVAAKVTIDPPTVLSLDDLAAVLRFFFAIFDVVRRDLFLQLLV